MKIVLLSLVAYIHILNSSLSIHGLTLDISVDDEASMSNNVITFSGSTPVKLAGEYTVYTYFATPPFNIKNVVHKGNTLLLNGKALSVSFVQNITLYLKGNVPLLLYFLQPGIIYGTFIYYKNVGNGNWAHVNVSNYSRSKNNAIDINEIRALLDEIFADLKIPEPEPKTSEKDRAVMAHLSVLTLFLYLFVFLGL